LKDTIIDLVTDILYIANNGEKKFIKKIIGIK